MKLNKLIDFPNQQRQAEKNGGKFVSNFSETQKAIIDAFFAIPRTQSEIETLGFLLVGDPQTIGKTEETCPNLGSIYPYYVEQAQRALEKENTFGRVA